MYFDPCFKTISFLDNTIKDKIRNNVKLLLIELIEQQQVSREEELLPQCDEMPAPKKKKLATFFEGMIGSGPVNSTQCLSADEIASNEIRRYDAEDPESLDVTKPLKWWKSREQQLQYLCQLVKQTLCITASSVPSK